MGHEDEHAEETLGAPISAAPLDLAVSAVPVMISVMGSGGAGQFFNERWLAFTGRVLDDEIGFGWLGVVHPDDRETVRSAFRDRATEGQAFELEYRARRFDGAYRWLLAHGAPRLGPDGTVSEYVGAAIDVTERRQLEAERTSLLAEANDANARLAALQELTARLADLTRPEEVAAVVLGQGVAELQATTGSLCLLSGDGTDLEVAAEVGYPAEVTRIWGRFPLDAPTPAGDAVRRGDAIYISSLAELHQRYPIFAGRPIVGDESLAVLPLATAGRRSLGAMVIGFARPRAFPPADRRLLTALAAQAANALARTESRAALEAAREQLGYLADASARLAGSLDLDETLATVASLAVPRLADRCSLYLLSNGRVETFLLEPADPGVDIRTLLDRYPVDLDSPSGVGAVLRTGQAEWLPRVDEAMLAESAGPDERHELLVRIGFGAVLILPLRARGRMLGAIALTNASGRPMTEQQRDLAEELAARAAVAIDNARLFATQLDVARRLQRSLLPPALPVISGVDVAARYAAAGEGVEVGGDFYDFISCGDGRWLLVVGDVKGKGVEAAVLTGLARHTIRTAAIDHAGPAAVVSLLNEMLIRHEAERTLSNSDDWETSEPRFCTVAAVALSPAATGYEAVVASAGHPLPLVRHPDGRINTVGRPGTLLGIHPLVEITETRIILEPGAVLACFTDGVSECHDGARFFDDDGVAEVIARTSGSAEDTARAIETAARGFAAGQVIKDDMAILVARIL